MKGYLKNSSLQREFHLVAFSSYSEWQYVLFAGVLLMYLLALLGNLTITTLFCLVPQLHTPMYFFLCNLSVQDIVYVSTTLPKLLAITGTGDTRIPFSDCITQMFLFTFCVGTEFFLLTSMAYDRYVAICVPLNYVLIMNKRICALLAMAAWIIGILNSLTHSLLISNLSYSNSKEINHFYCDLKTMIKVSSSDTTDIETVVSVECIFLGFFPFILILTSYICIVSSILKIKSSAGRVRVFSSCSSHLTIVILFYGTSLTFYMKPESEHSQEQDKWLSLLYTAVVPMLNPLVYSLRNKDVLRAMKILQKNSLNPLNA
ncbi:olfactory receptor 5AR1-like [Rhinophrynus dorsalis]